MEPAQAFEHLLLSVEPHERRMSHWVYAPKVVDTRDGRVLLDLTGTPWDLVSARQLPGTLELQLRQYPGDRPAISLGIGFADGQLRLGDQPVTVQTLEQALELALERTRA